MRRHKWQKVHNGQASWTLHHAAEGLSSTQVRRPAAIRVHAEQQLWGQYIICLVSGQGTPTRCLRVANAELAEAPQTTCTMTSKDMASCTCHQLVRPVEHADTPDGAAVHATSLLPAARKGLPGHGKRGKGARLVVAGVVGPEGRPGGIGGSKGRSRGWHCRLGLGAPLSDLDLRPKQPRPCTHTGLDKLWCHWKKGRLCSGIMGRLLRKA